MTQLTSPLFIYDISELDTRGFNLIFRLFKDKNNPIDLDDAIIFKLLSGLRVNPCTDNKVDKQTTKKSIKRLDKLGWIIWRHGRMRLGNEGLFFDYLNEENKEILRKRDNV